MAWRIRVGQGEDRDEVRHGAVADEPLRAVDDVGVTVAGRSGPRRRDIRARLGLRQRERDQLLARRETRQPAFLLLLGAGEDDRQRSELLHGEDQAARGAGATDLLDGDAERQELATEPAEALGERQRQDVMRSEQRAHVLRELGGPVDLGGARRDLLVGQDAHGVAQHRLLVGQSVGGAGAGRRGSHHGAS